MLTIVIPCVCNNAMMEDEMYDNSCDKEVDDKNDIDDVDNDNDDNADNDDDDDGDADDADDNDGPPASR